MTEHPLIVSTQLIPKVLDGTKTQTRRVIKPQPDNDEGDWVGCTNVYDHNIGEFCPYGQVGDRLWVRETWAEWVNETGDSIIYKADGIDALVHWRPSIFMPRWASRITLEITNLRVEKLQEITVSGCDAEGFARWGLEHNCRYCETDSHSFFGARKHFAELWDSLNAKHSWESNPWVWVIGFRNIKEV